MKATIKATAPADFKWAHFPELGCVVWIEGEL